MRTVVGGMLADSTRLASYHVVPSLRIIVKNRETLGHLECLYTDMLIYNQQPEVACICVCVFRFVSIYSTLFKWKYCRVQLSAHSRVGFRLHGAHSQ